MMEHGVPLRMMAHGVGWSDSLKQDKLIWVGKKILPFNPKLGQNFISKSFHFGFIFVFII